LVEGRGPEAGSRRIAVCRLAVDFRPSALDQFIAGDEAVADADDTLRVHGDFFLVGDEDDGVAPVGELLEQRHDFRAGLGIKIPRRFVRQQDGRPVHERAGDGDALAVTTGKFVRLVMHAVGQADVSQCFQCELAGVPGMECPNKPRAVPRCARRRTGEQVERLKDKTDFAVRISASWLSFISLTRWPLSSYSPPVGVSRQPTRFINVDLPEPDGPMMADVFTRAGCRGKFRARRGRFPCPSG